MPEVHTGGAEGEAAAGDPPPAGTARGIRGSAWILAAAAAALTALVVARFPIYFRGDDVYFLEWAHAHADPLGVFRLHSGLHAFRPITSFAWWACYRLFGLDPLPYQVLLTFTYFLALIAYYRALRPILGVRAARWAVAGYLVVFYSLGQIVFWLSDLSFALEMLFLHLALLAFVRGVGRPRWMGAAVLAYAAAGLSKEVSILLGPLLFAAYAFAARPGLAPSERRRSAAWSAALLVLGAGAILLHPTVTSRATVDLASGVAGVRPQWSYYARELLSGTGLLLVAAAVSLAARTVLGSRRWGRGASLAAGPAAAVLLRGRPEVALLVVFAAAPFLVADRRRRLAVGAVWLAAPVAGLMTSEYLAHAYLFEASFGAGLLVGVFLDDLHRAWAGFVRRVPRRWAAAAVAVTLAAILAGAVRFGEKAERKLIALDALSAGRANARALIERYRDRYAGDGVPLVVIDYTDLGLDYRRDIFLLSDLEKARTQKTLVGSGVEKVLRLMGTPTRVRDLAWMEETRADSARVLVMTGIELERLRASGYRLRELYAAPRGEEPAWIFEATRPREP